MCVVVVPLSSLIFGKVIEEVKGTAKCSNGAAKGCSSCRARKMIRSCSVDVQERDVHGVPLNSIATGCCGGQKHKDIKGFTSEILRFMTGKVTADRRQLLAKPVKDGQGCEVKEICHCFLYSFRKRWLSAAVRGRCLSSGDLVPCTSWFCVIISICQKHP